LIDDVAELPLDAPSLGKPGAVLAPTRDLVRTLRGGMQPHIQAELVRALAPYRSSETISVLSELVVSGESEVWKAALDALVTAGGDEARKALQQASHLAGSE
jgi:hypothetical protein